MLQPRPLSTENLRLAAELEVAPNPVQDQLNLRVSGNERGNYTARVFDVAGKQWLERELTLTGGEDRFAIPAYDLPQGLYYLQLTNGIASATLRVVKQ